ncbi:MAG: hypothetical protein CL607_09090 [Anaerolineaceae bacterium]|nr:hypothetical protein [Anaerolineaceae bacterium]
MSDEDITIWKVLGAVGKGVAKSIQVVGEGVNATAKAVNDTNIAVRSSMPVTEITSVFNTTDKTLRFVNRETARDEKEVLGQSAVSLKNEQTAGAWIPWYDPPRFGDFAARRLEILVEAVPVIYIWQKGEYVYWTNRLDSAGRPAKAYKMPGITHVGGKRTLVVRYDPDEGYSAFLSNVVDGAK